MLGPPSRKMRSLRRNASRDPVKNAMPPQGQRLHTNLTPWLYDVIIKGSGGKPSALKSLRNKDERTKGDIPMKKILISLMALGMFAAFSGIARAEGDTSSETTKTEKAGGKKTKTTKKVEKNADGTGSTETKTETTKTAK